MKHYLYKSMLANLKSKNGDINWELNKWLKHKGKLELCSGGFHASKSVIDAMCFVNAEIIAKVEVKGKHLSGEDKECWSEMKIVEAWEWKKEDSVSLAIYAAELVIDNFEKKYPNDKRPKEAIEAAKKWLKNPCEKTRSAAYAAYAASAASSATYAASSATYAASSVAYAAYVASSVAYAASSAAYVASYVAYAAYAASAASSATYAASYKKIKSLCEKFVLKRLSNAKKVK